jgi:hypothetical protein
MRRLECQLHDVAQRVRSRLLFALDREPFREEADALPFRHWRFHLERLVVIEMLGGLLEDSFRLEVEHLRRDVVLHELDAGIRSPGRRHFRAVLDHQELRCGLIHRRALHVIEQSKDESRRDPENEPRPAPQHAEDKIGRRCGPIRGRRLRGRLGSGGWRGDIEQRIEHGHGRTPEASSMTGFISPGRAGYLSIFAGPPINPRRISQPVRAREGESDDQVRRMGGSQR